MDTIAHFRTVVPGFMAKLLRDFPELAVEDAAAIFGNLGHESKGLTDDQEDKPLAGRGGINWSQWTGPRRRSFEAYCKRAKLDPNSDLAAYKYLFLELKGIEGSEGAALRKTMAAIGLEKKVVAFELAYLRAHPSYKHYSSRLQWAERAMNAWAASPKMLQPDPFGEVTGISPDMPTKSPEKAAAQAEAERGNFPLLGVMVALIVVAAALAVWFVFFKR